MISSQGEQEYKVPCSALHCRHDIQAEHNHHGSDAALLLFGISFTRDAEPYVEMKKPSKVLDSA